MAKFISGIKSKSIDLDSSIQSQILGKTFKLHYILGDNDFADYILPDKAFTLKQRMELLKAHYMFESTCVFAEITAANIEDDCYLFNNFYRIKDFPVTDSNFNTFRQCLGEDFSMEPILGYFSGFWISKDVVVSVAHALNSPMASIQHSRILRGYYQNTVFGNTVKIPFSQSFEIQERIIPEKSNCPYDIVFYKVKDNGNLYNEAIKMGEATVGDNVISIGYPLGIPAKMCKVGNILDEDDTYYYTSLDAFNKSSGSAVFNLKNELIGMVLTRGKGNEFNIDEECKCWRFAKENYEYATEKYIKVLKTKAIYEQFLLTQ